MKSTQRKNTEIKRWILNDISWTLDHPVCSWVTPFEHPSYVRKFPLLFSVFELSFCHTPKRNPDRFTPRHGIFHKKQVPAGLLAEWGKVTTGIVTPYTLGHESLALPAATHCSWLPPSGKRLRPWALQQATSTLFGSPSLPASLNGTCIYLFCSICRAIGQI